MYVNDTYLTLTACTRAKLDLYINGISLKIVGSG